MRDIKTNRKSRDLRPSPFRGTSSPPHTGRKRPGVHDEPPTWQHLQFGSELTVARCVLLLLASKKQSGTDLWPYHTKFWAIQGYIGRPYLKTNRTKQSKTRQNRHKTLIVTQHQNVLSLAGPQFPHLCQGWLGKVFSLRVSPLPVIFFRAERHIHSSPRSFHCQGAPESG